MTNIAIAILAAGQGTRMGRPKQLAEYEGERLLSRAIRTAVQSAVGPVFVVLGSHYPALSEHVPPDVQIVWNDFWSEGIASSIRAAVSALGADHAALAATYADAVIFMSCDQPFVEPSLLRQIAGAFRTESNKHPELPKASVVAANYGTPEEPGIPALFARSRFSELLQLTGDRGAKKLIDRNDACLISAPEAAFDIDTEEDLKRMDSKDLRRLEDLRRTV